MMDDQSGPVASTTADEILAYLAGELSPAEDEDLQERLSRDPQATQLLLDLADPSRLVDEGENGWEPLRDALRSEGVFKPVPRPILTKLRPYYPLAAAALLAASFGLGLGLGHQTGGPQHDDIAIWELLPEGESGRRDGDEEIRAGTHFVHDLVLYANDITSDGSYRLIVADQQGTEKLRRSLRAHAPGRVVLRLEANDLEVGLYAARLLTEGDPETLVATYRLVWQRP